jgi:drug/metabolite transporter (DMT)-like permease
VLLLALCLGARLHLAGYSGKTWLQLVALTVGPQLLGHTVFNYLLAHVEASVVAISVTAEPIGASLLAFAAFGEVPTASAVVGGALILSGIYVAIAAQARVRVEIQTE